jgi:hypothetical protein
MIGRLISFLSLKLGLSSIIVELILCGGCVAGAFWWLKVHDAKVYTQAHAEGVLYGTEQTIKQKEKEWAIVYNNIEAERAKNKLALENVEKVNVELAQNRAELEQKLKIAKTKVVTRIVEIPVKVNEIPPDALVDSIRVKSADLAGLPTASILNTGILAEKESRLVLTELNELGVRRTQVTEYEDIIEQSKIQCENERNNCVEKVKGLEGKISIVEKERDVALDKAKVYEGSYKLVTKKRGAGCTVMKILTLGMYKCR